MDRAWLAAQLEAGRSYEDIGREVGRHGSTLAYWAKRHGLRSRNADRFGSRGAPDRETLAELAAQGATLAEIASSVDRSIATVRHWLGRWQIARVPRPGRVDPATAPPMIELACTRHGRTPFRLEGRGYYRCMRCRQERVSEWRRRVKRTLIQEAGGRCRLCGYDECPAVLQFHHVDPSQKAFELSQRGAARSLVRARAEARKCVLLCANCHAEVEAGYRRLDDGLTRGSTPRGGLEPP